MLTGGGAFLSTATGMMSNMASVAANLPLSFLIMSSVLPIVKVLLIAGTGLLFALPEMDVLHADARKSLSKLVFTVFLPAIIFVNLGEAISLEKLMMWWFIPVNVILSSVAGCLLGMLIAWLTNCPPQYFRIASVLTGIGNMGNMPLVLLSAVCSDARNPFGGHDSCSKLGTAYISLGMWMAAIVMWAVVYNVLAPPEEWLPGYHRPPFDMHIDQKFVHTPLIPFHPSLDDGHLGDGASEEEVSIREGSSRRGRLMEARRALRKASVVVLVDTPNKFADIMRMLHVYDILRPPVLAAFLAMILGMIPPLDYLFFNKNGALRFLSDALGVLGQAMIPCILLVLGGNLVKGPGASGLPASTTIAVVVARLLVVPLMGIGIVLAADWLGLLPPDDKMFRFVLLIQHAMPSSIQIGTACSLRGFGEKEVSAVLFYQHISAVITMALYLFIFFFILYH